MNNHNPLTNFNNLRINKAILFGVLIVSALIAFEMFNYSTTEFALLDLLGDLSFLGVRWATILSIAFCGIDFAGIARLFTPEKEERSPLEAWYLLGAWLLAAIMNAALTWWGISIALVNHESFKNILLEEETIIRYVPIFVALLVWLIRVLIIGTMSTAGDQIFSGPLFLPNKYRDYHPNSHLARREDYVQQNTVYKQRPVPTFRPGNRNYDAFRGEIEPDNKPSGSHENDLARGGRKRKF
jgi:hypothetical protein